MKVLFLDFDGVINSVRSATAFGGYPWDVKEESLRLFDQVAVGLIRLICKDTGTKIVLSSTWRASFPYKYLGEKLDLPIIDATPVKLSGGRGHEIAAWLASNKVDKYAIVDDDRDMLKSQLPFFVNTCPYEGLTWKDALRLKELLT